MKPIPFVLLGISLIACGEAPIEGEVGQPRSPDDNGAAGGDNGAAGGDNGAASGDPGATPPPIAVGDFFIPCPDPLEADASQVLYVCDCGTGADPDCVAGSDSANGTSPSTPKQTYQTARSTFQSMPAGGMVAFCRGGSIAVAGGNRNWVNSDCRAGDPCIVRDYDPTWASGDEEDPLLKSTGGNTFEFVSATLSPDGGYQILNLQLQGDGGDGWGTFFYNDSNDTLLCNLEIFDMSIGVHVAGANTPGVTNDRIELRNSYVHDNASDGWLGAGDGCGVRGTKFENNGFGGPTFNHSIYFNEGPATGMFAINNEVYKSTRVGGSCQGVSFVVHGIFDQLLIEGNYLHEDVGAVSPTCYGIGLAFGYSGAESFTNVTIRGNMVENFGAIGIAAEGCQNCLIENNVVIHNQSSDITMITNDLGGGSGGDTRSDANIIRNNSLIATGGSDVEGISLGAAGSNHISVNNVLQYTGTGNFDCFRYDLANSAYSKRDNNICYAPNGNLDADGASLVADPLFTSVEAPFDLAPRATSPARDAGDAELASTVDIDGEERDSSPDIGAYEVR